MTKPTGSYGVGTCSYHFVDRSRKEKRGKDPRNPFRELMVSVWYPADTKGLREPVGIVSDRLARFIKKESVNKNWFYGSGYIGVGVKSNAFASAPAIQGYYPVIVFSPGYGCPTHTYTSFFEELASHGFVVVGINHTYTSDPIEFPDGRIIQLDPQAHLVDEVALRQEDIIFVLQQMALINKHDEKNVLTGHLDLDRVCFMGHSLGATVSLELGKHEKSCKAVIAMDGMIADITTAYTTPLLLMYNGSHGSHSKNDSDAPRYDLKAIHEKMVHDVSILCKNALSDVYQLQFSAHHMTFSDYFLHTKQVVDYERERALITACKKIIVDFCRVYLKGESREIIMRTIHASSLKGLYKPYVYTKMNDLLS